MPSKVLQMEQVWVITAWHERQLLCALGSSHVPTSVYFLAYKGLSDVQKNILSPHRTLGAIRKLMHVSLQFTPFKLPSQLKSQ